jgi:hypothetical protein
MIDPILSAVASRSLLVYPWCKNARTDLSNNGVGRPIRIFFDILKIQGNSEATIKTALDAPLASAPDMAESTTGYLSGQDAGR